jgi:MFS family permease
MIAVALPTLAREFDITTSHAAVLITVYLAAMLIGQPIAGRLGDAIGARRLAIIAVSGFGLCSAAAMFAPTFGLLVAIRALQAAFASALSPSVQSLLRAITTSTERGRAFGLQGSVNGVGAGLVTVIGGLLLAGFGWRAIFAINIPIVVVILIVLERSVPVEPGTARDPARARLEHGSGFTTPALTIAERRLFNRVFSAACSTQALSTFGQDTLLLVTPIVLDARGWGTGPTGMALSALTLGMIVMSPPGGRLGDRFGRRFPALIGLSVATGALALAEALAADIASAVLIGALLVFGLGLGLATPSVLTAGIEAAPMSRVGLAAGVLSTGRYVGSIIASVLLGLVVADSGDGVTTMLVVSMVALIASLGSAANFPGRLPPSFS